MVKCISHCLVLFILFISCDKNLQVEKKSILKPEIVIPLIKKVRSDVNFKLKNGILYFKKNPYSGTVQQFYENGNLKSTSTYNQGKREGKYIGFYPNQKKWFERFYTEGIKVKTHKGWYKNEQQMFEYQFNNEGIYNGVVKEWHINGQLAKHFNFENGKETGSQKMWQSTGKIKANFFTINGERHGLIGLKNCVSVAKAD